MAYRSYYRTYPRYPTQYPIISGWASGVEEGLVTNLSFSGCTVQCGRSPLVGAEVRVSILLPDRTQALPIKSGTIRWAECHQFGVKFQRLALARIIHERFYCNRRYAATTSLAASFARPAGGLAPRNLDILFQVCLGLSRLHAPVSPGVSAVSSRIVMNNAG